MVFETFNVIFSVGLHVHKEAAITPTRSFKRNAGKKSYRAIRLFSKDSAVYLYFKETSENITGC